MKKSFLIIGLVIAVVLMFLLADTFLGYNSVTNAITASCKSRSFAWTPDMKMDCDCQGILLDTSCHSCLDASETWGCLGTATNEKCYYSNPLTARPEEIWQEIPCNADNNDIRLLRSSGRENNITICDGIQHPTVKDVCKKQGFD